MKLKAGQIIILFLTLYLVLGLTNYTLKGTPNGTNDFLAHYYKTTGDIENEKALEYYSPDFLEKYPQVFHILAKPFAVNEFGFYAFAVILVCLIAPALLYKIAGDFAVFIYFAISLPHMILYNATFPSFLIMIYVLIYLLNRKNWKLLIVLAMLAVVTHKHGFFIFALICFAEMAQIYFTDKKFLAGLLVGVKASTPAQVLMIFINHVNIYFVWIARKKFTIFYSILFGASVIASIFYETRTIILAQIILCVLVGETFQTTKPSKLFWVIWILILLFNFFDFFIGTEKFIFM